MWASSAAGGGVEVEGLERGAPLQREPAPRRGGKSIGTRSELRSGEAQDMVTGDRRECRAALRRGGAATLERASRPPQLPAQLAEEICRLGWLTPAVDLAQAAPLIEAATQLLRGGIRVGVQHGRVRHVRAGVAGA